MRLRQELGKGGIATQNTYIEGNPRGSEPEAGSTGLNRKGGELY